MSFLPCGFLGRNLKKSKKKRKRNDQFVRPKNKGHERTQKREKLFKNRTTTNLTQQQQQQQQQQRREKAFA